MRVLFFMRSLNYGRHFEGLLRGLLEPGHEVHIALERGRKGIKGDPEVFEALRDEFGGRLSWGMAARERAPAWEAFAVNLRLGLDYLRYRDPYFAEAKLLSERARGRAPQSIVRLAGWPGGRRALPATLRHLEAALPLDAGLVDEVRRRAPDVVLVSPLVSLGSGQGDAVRAARAAGVPVALPVASWDNLTNKGVIRDEPDLTMVWNAAQAREAVELHELREEAVLATGAHNYDHWFRWQPSGRREFCERVGLDPERPYILYVGSTAFIAPHEPRFVGEWMTRLRASAEPALGDAGVLIRPHPMNARGWAASRLTEPGRTVIWPPEGTIPTAANAKREYYDSIHHARAVVGINTSAFIEGAIVGRPAYTLITNTYRDSQEGTLHFAHLSDLLNVARTWDEHHAQLATVLEDPAPQARRVSAFVERFVRPHGVDLEATGIAVAAIEDLARRGAPVRGRPRGARALGAALRGPVAIGHALSGRRGGRRLRVRPKRWAAPQPGAPLRVMLVLRDRDDLAALEPHLRALADRGHALSVAFGERVDGAGNGAIAGGRFEVVDKPARRRKGRYARAAHRVRRATERASGPRLLSVLRRMEDAIPTDPKIDDMLIRAAPDALILTPPSPADEYATDYAKSARGLGIPASVWTPEAADPDEVERLARAARTDAPPAKRRSDAVLRALLRVADVR